MEVRISFERLIDLPLFDGMSVEEIGEVLSKVNVIAKRYRKNNPVVLAGDYVQHVCILIEGSVQMIKEDVLGDRAIIANIGPGAVFAETLFGRKYDHSVVSFFATTDSIVLMLPFDKFLNNVGASAANTKLVCNLVSIMADNSIRLIEKTEVLSKRTLRDKILAYLEQELKRSSSKRVTIPFNRTDLANYLDADRSSLTRELTKMREAGIIAYERNTFEILQA